MSEVEIVEDNDDVVFLEAQSTELDVRIKKLSQHVNARQLQLQNLKKQWRELAVQENLLKTALSDKTFRLEFMLATTKPWYWVVLVVIAAICLMGAVANKGWWFLVPINWVAFLLVWRTLYVKNNVPSLLFAVLINAYTLILS